MQLLDFTGLLEPSISEEENAELCAPPMDDEIKQAVFFILSLSFLGLDRFGSEFFMVCRDIVKAEIVEAACDFFNGAKLPRFYSSSYIILAMARIMRLSLGPSRRERLCVNLLVLLPRD